MSEYSNKEQLRRDIPGAVRLELLPETDPRPERFAALVGEFLAGKSE